MFALVRNIALALTLFVCLATPHISFAKGSPEPDGIWHGALQTPQGPIMLAVTISRATDGSLTATVENADQGPGNLVPVSTVTVQNDQLGSERSQKSAPRSKAVGSPPTRAGPAPSSKASNCR